MKKSVKGLIIAGALLLVGAIVVISIILGVQDQEDSKSNIVMTKQQKIEYVDLYGDQDYAYAFNWAINIFNQDRRLPKEESIAPFRETYTVEDVVISSSKDGHKIPADYILADNDKNNNTMILVHGYGCNRRSNMDIERKFLEWGYNVLSFDLSGAGENSSDLATYGALEQFEVLDCINYIRQYMDDEKNLVLYGYSYGGGVTGVSLGNPEIDSLVDYAIMDCPIGSMRKNIEFYTETMNKGASYDYIFECIDHLSNYLYGFTSEDASAEACIKTSATPVLIFTTRIDTQVPMSQAQAVFDAVSHDKKYLHTFDDVEHTMALWSDQADVFLEIIHQFVNGSSMENIGVDK